MQGYFRMSLNAMLRDIKGMVVSFPCEEPEYLLELMRKRKFQGSKLRTNVARGQPTEKHPSGRVMLKEAVLSDVVKSGRIMNCVRKHLGGDTKIIPRCRCI